MTSPRKQKKLRTDDPATLYGGMKSELPLEAKQLYQKRQSSQRKSATSGSPLHLNYEKFLFLTGDAMSGVCQFLHPLDLLSLARTSRRLREVFLSRTSLPYWSAARPLSGMPNWSTVAPPLAASLFYESGCQGLGCDNRKSLVLALHLCRRFCPTCARKNLLLHGEAQEQFPAIPGYMIEHLPWTAYRVHPSDPDATKDRYYLNLDLQSLDRRVTSMKASGTGTMTALRHELAVFQKARRASIQAVDRWYAAFRRRHETRLNQRWSIIADAFQSRWGWEPVEYEELGLRLRRIVDHLLAVPVLSEKEWQHARGDIQWAIEEEARVRTLSSGRRAFTLRKPAPP